MTHKSPSKILLYFFLFSYSSVGICSSSLSGSLTSQEKILNSTKQLKEYLILHHEKINDINPRHGFRPLMYLAYHGASEEVIQFFLNNGADQKLRHINGMKSIHLAAFNGKAHSLRALIDHVNFDPQLLNSRTKRSREDELAGIVASPWSRTALHLSAMNGYADCVRTLIARGADIFLNDSRGLTALHLAAEGSHIECIKALLDAGASAYDRDSAGLGITPFDFAVMGQHHFAAAYLVLDDK